ncbi:Thiol:disulfide interchange protein DsbA [Candidatus Providencia siddallii]|uniref:Thiol:disulfide interchange protein n=1 Tax=Candidatus Providencia siddallii TaxID=1715285 RepID=A0A0M6W6V7_9GAMM|nr:Thiol:disulfide interchange protein DsbA [Candidatus Providencia siddallii]
MKKNMLALFFVIMSFRIYAVNYIEGKEYVEIKYVHNLPQIIEFFSFYCLHCYQFEIAYKIPKIIEKNLLKKIKIERYHVDFFGPLGDELTKAWAVAIILKIEDKMMPILFESVLKKQNLKNKEDIRNVFIKANVSSKDYDAIFNSFLMKYIVKKQQNVLRILKPTSVPLVYVNGKYQLCNDKIFIDKNFNYGKDFSKIINYLIDKN